MVVQTLSKQGSSKNSHPLYYERDPSGLNRLELSYLLRNRTVETLTSLITRCQTWGPPVYAEWDPSGLNRLECSGFLKRSTEVETHAVFFV